MLSLMVISQNEAMLTVSEFDGSLIASLAGLLNLGSPATYQMRACVSISSLIRGSP